MRQPKCYEPSSAQDLEAAADDLPYAWRRLACKRHLHRSSIMYALGTIPAVDEEHGHSKCFRDGLTHILAHSLVQGPARKQGKQKAGRSIQYSDLLFCYGAGNGTRTRECQLGKLMPYHLAMPAICLPSESAF